MIKFDAYEKSALIEGGNKGGTYLDTIGKTDLAALHPEEWEIFLQEVMTGYVESMRETLGSGKAPF